MELRALMSANDASTAWDLRVYIRENLLKFIKENYPGSLPQTRLILKENRPPEEGPSSALQKLIPWEKFIAVSIRARCE